MTARKNAAAIPAPPAPRAPAGRRLAGAAVLGAAVLAAAGALAGGAARADATVLTNCAPTPGTCSYPGAATTGVPAGTTLKQVPAQVTSGPGWTWNATTKTAVVTADGTVVSGLSVSGTLQINADNVTVKNVKVTTGGNFGISLTHTAGVTIANSTISGQNATTGRVPPAGSATPLTTSTATPPARPSRPTTSPTSAPPSRSPPAWPTATTSTTPASPPATTPTASMSAAAPSR